MKTSLLAIVLAFLCLTFTKVTAQQNNIPVAKVSAESSTEVDSKTKGNNILLATRKAMGGEALQKIKDIVNTSEVTLALQADIVVKNQTVIKYPDKFVTTISGPFGDSRQAYDGKIAWRKNLGAVDEYSGAILNEFRNAMTNDSLYLLTHFDASGFQTNFVGESTLDSHPVNIVAITTPTGYEVKLGIDAESNMILFKQFTSNVGNNSIDNEEILSDYHDIEGVKVPYKRLLKRNGQDFAETKVKDIKVNTNVEDALFAKPAK